MNVKEINNYMMLAKQLKLAGWERLKTLNFKCLLGFLKEATEFNVAINLLMSNPYLIPAVILYLAAINTNNAEESKELYKSQLISNCKFMVKYTFPWYSLKRYTTLKKVKKLCENI